MLKAALVVAQTELLVEAPNTEELVGLAEESTRASLAASADLVVFAMAPAAALSLQEEAPRLEEHLATRRRLARHHKTC